jgi:hypothetical protein
VGRIAFGVAFFVLVVLLGLTYAPPPLPSLRGMSLHMAALLVSGTLALSSVIWWIMGWLLAHLVIALHNLWIRFVVALQKLDPLEAEIKEMLRRGRETDMEEIVEQRLRRFHRGPDPITPRAATWAAGP